MKTVAIITMVYNEKHKLEVWLSHHAHQVGISNCFIIDHGSDDGSTEALFKKINKEYKTANFVRLPRTPYDDQVRVDAIAGLATFLLGYYDWVVFCDADELLLADPRKHRSLLDYFSGTDLAYVTSIGFDVVHKVGTESPLNAAVPVLSQRRHVRFSSSMCKQNAISKKVRWTTGFHTCNFPAVYDDLLLLHLRFADIDQGLERLSVTRSHDWQTGEGFVHQKISDGQFEKIVNSMANLPTVTDDPFSKNDGLVKLYLEKVKSSEYVGPNTKLFHVNLHIYGNELIKVPSEIVDAAAIHSVVN